MTSTPVVPSRFSTPPVLITGMSGGGLSSAAKVLEDKGFFVVQNLPPQLIVDFLELCLRQDPPVEKVSFVLDVRTRLFGGDLLHPCPLQEGAQVLAELSPRVVDQGAGVDLRRVQRQPLTAGTHFRRFRTQRHPERITQ